MQSFASTSSRPRVLMMVALLSVALLGLGTALFAISTRPTASAAPAGEAGNDARLVLHARSAPIGGLLADGTRLTGTLYPAMPGANTVRMVLQGRAATRPLGGRIELVATMPGMAMVPARATLIARNGAYTGVLTLPMFGRYQARAVLDTPTGRITGRLVLAVNLPRVSP